MKFSTEKNEVPCGHRSVAECNCYENLFTEDNALRDCVQQFSKELLGKLYKKEKQGYSGWDNEDWTREEIIKALKAHIKKGDMIDIAAFAMFAWNRDGVDSDTHD